MISYSFRCRQAHAFEAWMPSSDACDRQLAENLVECPFCGSSEVSKAIMAPAVRSSERVEAIKRIEARWVGDRFAAEARSMEEASEDVLVGTATPEEVDELMEDGIDFTLLGRLPNPN